MTPRVQNGPGAGRHTDSGHQEQLCVQANQWQTPQTDSFRCRGGDRKNEMGLDQQARHFPLPQDQQTHDGPPSSQPAQILRRRLNPRFVEWLMGFPIGWGEL